MPIPIRSGPYKTFHPLRPYQTYLEFEGSNITIPMRGRMTENSPWIEDEITLDAFMRLEVFPAYVNGLGTREFQFVIRDWELHGTCPLLNKLFFDHPLGRECRQPDMLKKTGRAAGERQPAVLTFTVSHSYFKEGDDSDTILGPASDLEIRNLTSHDLHSVEADDEGGLKPSVPGNSIFWQVDVSRNSARVVFYRRPPGNADLVPKVDENEHHESILAAQDVPLNEPRFVARKDPEQYGRNSNIVRAEGNTILSPLMKARSPIEIRWRLGEKPRDGNGRIRIVSPARSLCTADQRPDPGMPFDSTDFPARITYAINYDIFINDQRFVHDQAGIAIAVGAAEIPPRDVKVAFDKPHVGRVLGRFLEFGPGCCIGMRMILEWLYRIGARYCRYCRQTSLDSSGPWPEPFDPQRDY